MRIIRKKQHPDEYSDLPAAFQCVDLAQIDTDFTMVQIAQMIGYSTSSRFAEPFKKNTDILPIEYRKTDRKYLRSNAVPRS